MVVPAAMERINVLKDDLFEKLWGIAHSELWGNHNGKAH